MSKEFTSLGLMSGTSGDGVDASIIKSDGKSSYKVIANNYYKYSEDIYETFHSMKEKINNKKDLNFFSDEIKNLERKITMFHIKVVSEMSKKNKIELVGFHGQTIYHNAQEKISLQLGDGNLLSKLSKKDVVYNFRKNDIENGGEGAPLTPIFHQLILKQNNIKIPSCILNIGGISNVTTVDDYSKYSFTSRDIGPGNCLIDEWVRKNSNQKYDKNGKIASIGNINEIILEQAQELYLNRSNTKNLSMDVSDFDISFARGLSLEDGTATLTNFTAGIISAALSLLPPQKGVDFTILVSGGGRKNISLINLIKRKLIKDIILKPIDDYGIDGDFVESQAFGFLSIRKLIGQPISFPNTTGCLSPTIGGTLIKFK